MATVDPRRATRASRVPGRARFPGFASARRRQARHPRLSTCELILEGCRVPKANVLGELGKGYKIAIET
jgi:alkylation response protein AidB-like acyl-CoA dehydrogenase